MAFLKLVGFSLSTNQDGKHVKLNQLHGILSMKTIINPMLYLLVFQ